MLIFGFIKFHEGFSFFNELAFLLMTEGFDFETLFELDGFFHGGGAGRFCEFDLLSVILVEGVKIFRFVSGTHVKILIHVLVLLS